MSFTFVRINENPVGFVRAEFIESIGGNEEGTVVTLRGGNKYKSGLSPNEIVESIMNALRDVDAPSGYEG